MKNSSILNLKYPNFEQSSGLRLTRRWASFKRLQFCTNLVKKDDNFECGIDGQGNARFPVSIRYFMTAILFVLFDVEVIFFYPYAVNFYELKLEGLLAVIMFVGFFLTGFYYIYKKGALEWEK